MVSLDEARRPRPPFDVEFSDMWHDRASDVTDEIELRVRQLIAHYRDGTRLRGVDKASGPPYDSLGIRHSHARQRRLDPIVMYQFFPATQENPVPRLHFITPSTHSEAFRGNEENFIQFIKQTLGESRIVATAA